MQSVFDLIFRPLARLAIARNVGFAAVSARLKLAFLTAARDAAPEATDSRLSVMTGLQRRDIARLSGGDAPETERAPQPLARIVARWSADPVFAGQPLPVRGPDVSFEALAQAVHRDVHPRTYLDQLIAAGTVAEEDGKVRLLQDAYQPLAGSDDQLAYLAANVSDHLAASVANVVEAPLYFERAVHYDGLSAEAVAELDALWRAQCMAALEAVNARALALQSDGPQRFRAGGYFYAKEDGS